jgi:hypothetical protein
VLKRGVSLRNIMQKAGQPTVRNPVNRENPGREQHIGATLRVRAAEVRQHSVDESRFGQQHATRPEVCSAINQPCTITAHGNAPAWFKPTISERDLSE